MRARLLGAIALSLVMGWTAHASAEEPRRGSVFLAWSSGAGTEDCITPEEAEAEVERMLERRVFVARESADRTLEVRLERTEAPRGYAAHLALRSKRGVPLGEREIAIETDRCQDATEALTLALSIMTDLPPTPEEAAELAAPPAPPPRPRPRPTPRPPRGAPSTGQGRGLVALGPAGTLDTGGDLAPGGMLLGLVEAPHLWPLSASALGTVRSFLTPRNGRFWVSSMRLDLSLCLPPWRSHAVELDGCLGPETTLFAAWGQSLAENRGGLSATFGGLAQGLAMIRASRSVRVFLALGLSATPQRITVESTTPGGDRVRIYQTSAVTAGTALGVAIDIF